MKLDERIKELKERMKIKDNEIKTIQKQIEQLQNKLNFLIQEHLILQGRLSECEYLKSNGEEK